MQKSQKRGSRAKKGVPARNRGVSKNGQKSSFLTKFIKKYKNYL